MKRPAEREQRRREARELAAEVNRPDEAELRDRATVVGALIRIGEVPR